VRKEHFQRLCQRLAFVNSRRGLLGLLLYYAMVNFLLNVVGVLNTPMILAAHSAGAGRNSDRYGLGCWAAGCLMSTWGGPKTLRIPKVIGFITLSVLGLVVAACVRIHSSPASAFLSCCFLYPSPPERVWRSGKRKSTRDARTRVLRALIDLAVDDALSLPDLRPAGRLLSSSR